MDDQTAPTPAQPPQSAPTTVALTPPPHIPDSETDPDGFMAWVMSAEGQAFLNAANMRLMEERVNAQQASAGDRPAVA